MSMNEPSQRQLVPVTQELNAVEEISTAQNDNALLTYPSQSQNIIDVPVSGGTYGNANFGHDNRSIHTVNNTHIYNNITPHSQERGLDSLEGSEPALKKPRQENDSDELILTGGVKAFKTKVIHKVEGGKAIIYEGEKKKARGVHKAAVKLLLHSEQAMREADSLEAIRYHPNVVGIYETGTHLTDAVQHIFIAMELCSKKTLYDYVKEIDDFNQQQAIDHSTQIISGLTYIHELGIAHRDLEPENILFADDAECNRIKIADFGDSENHLTNPRATTNIMPGTDGYIAPELIRREEVQDPRKCDIFALGILLYFRLSKGKHPYGDKDWQWKCRIAECHEPDLSQICLSEGNKRNAAVLIIKKMLQQDPKDRPTAAKILKEWKAYFDVVSGEELATQPMAIGTTKDEESQTDNGNDANDENKCSAGEESTGPSFFKAGIIGFGRHKLSYWNSSDELDSKPTPVADLLTTIQKQTFTAVAVGRRVSVLTWLKQCYEYDLDSVVRIWTQLPSMLHLHGRYPPATACDGVIYACGGGWKEGGYFHLEDIDLPFATKACEVLSGGKWCKRQNMEEYRGGNCVVSLEGIVYSIGGWNLERKLLNTAEKYCPLADKWEKIKPLKEPRYNAAAVAHDRKLYVAGGSNGEQRLDSIECYNPNTNCWTVLKSKLPLLGHRISAFAFGDKVITLFGLREFTTIQQLSLDEEDDQSESSKDLALWVKAVIAIEEKNHTLGERV